MTLKGCEIAPDVNIAQEKYGIKLSVPSQDGMSELWIKCENVSSTCSTQTFFQRKVDERETREWP